MANTKNPHINPLGFREYDARWLYPKDINLEGIKEVGLGFGTQIISKTNIKTCPESSKNAKKFFCTYYLLPILYLLPIG